jgi:lipid-A-disaccharide synthase
MMKLKIFILAGEASGDLHASRLMRAIKALIPDTQFIGIGGRNMEKEGLESLVSIEQMSVVGFWEVAKRYSFFRKTLEDCKRTLVSSDVDAFIPVDYPGFNLKLGQFAKQSSIPVYYYIAPQLWAWGKGRAKKLSSQLDKLFVVLPFEVKFFNNFGIDAHFVGHPLLENEEFSFEVPTFDQRENIIAYLPGSRKQELAKHLPIIRSLAKGIKINLPDYRHIIAKSPVLSESFYSEILQDSMFELSDSPRELMLKAKAGVVKTGTSTLEAAFLGLPFVMFYKTSPITYFLGKKLINLDSISLVNILAKKKVITEYIQNEISPEAISDEIADLVSNKDRINQLQTEFLKLKEMLGNSPASENAAKLIIESIEKNEFKKRT